MDDAAPVTHEPFRQWVIEDRFCAGRPPWEEAGATFAPSVHAHEAMKLRLLNAGHQVIANPGEVLGIETIAGCMADPDVGPFLGAVLGREVAGHVDAVPGRTPASYIDLVSGRFANPLIHDTVRRVAFDGSARHAAFLLPTLRDALAAGAPVEGLALVEALWMRMCEGVREDGGAIAPNDPHWDARQRAARAGPAAWLAQDDVYGDLGGRPAFAAPFAAWHGLIARGGVRPALRRYLAGEGAPG